MRSTTLYLRPPDKGSRTPKGAWDELSRAAYRYRIEAAPFGLAFGLYVATAATGPRLPWLLPLIFGASAVAVYAHGDRLKLKAYKLTTVRRRAYLAVVLALLGAWSWFAVAWSADAKPGLRFIAALILGTPILAAPWWRYRRNFLGRIPVTFEPVEAWPIDRHRRRDYRRWHRSCADRAREMIDQWEGSIRGTSALGSKILSIHFDRWSIAMRVRLARARVAEDFTELRLRRLESAFGVDRNSARVDYPDKGKSREAVIKFMLRDPHGEPIVPGEDDLTGDLELTADIGRFEDNTRVIIDLIHTLIAGASGAGKSAVVNAIMRALSRKRHVAIVGIDLKPGCLELGKWEDVLYALAKTGDQARDLLDGLFAGITRRGEIMRERGIREWVATEAEPFVALIIDEVQLMKEFRLFPRLTKISELSRAYGFAMIIATQHPKDKSVPTEAIANCTQRIGLKTNASTAERLIFDDNATRDGWRLTNLPGDREGSFLIKSKKFRRPKMARAHWLNDLRVEQEVDLVRAFKTSIDAGTWGGDVQAIEPGDDTDVAVIIEDGPEDLVMMMIATGQDTPSKIAGSLEMPERTVYSILKRLSAQGKIVQDGPRKPWRLNRQ